MCFFFISISLSLKEVFIWMMLNAESPFITKHFLLGFIAPLTDSRAFLSCSRKSFYFFLFHRQQWCINVRRWKRLMTMEIICYHLMHIISLSLAFVFGFDGLFISIKLKEKIKQLRHSRDGRFSRQCSDIVSRVRVASIKTFRQTGSIKLSNQSPFTIWEKCFSS